MSIKYWEYKGPFDLLWDLQFTINSYYHVINGMPPYSEGLSQIIELFRHKENFSEALLNFDPDGPVPQCGFKGHRFITMQTFLYGYSEFAPKLASKHKVGYFKHLSIDYARGEFTIEPGGCRSLFMKAMEIKGAKAWIRTDDFPIPPRLRNYLTEVSEIPDDYNIISYPGLEWGAVSNDTDLMTLGPDQISAFDFTKFYTVPEDIRNFSNRGSLCFSRPEVHQELEALADNIRPDARWYIEMLKPDPISEYHKHGQIVMALASVFSGVPIETSWIRTNDRIKVYS